MAQFDVYADPDSGGWLLDVQTDLLDGLNTRIVVPLIPIFRAPTPAPRLNPQFDIGGKRVVMATQFMSSVPASLLRSSETNLNAHRPAIIDAIDMVILGF